MASTRESTLIRLLVIGSGILLFAALLGCSGAPARRAGAGAAVTPPRIVLPQSGWTRDRVAVHLLNRLAFGPSPADLEEVARLGPAAWVARQMTPSAVDDAALEAKLRSFTTLSMSNAQLHASYPRPKPGDGEERDPERSPRVIGRELVSQKILRAVESRRQLQEVLADFWFNHFNVFVGKGQDRWLVTSYERDALRPLLFGRFRDLLGATAASPAMLFYLDNWVSTREGFAPRGKLGPRGLNENYARELLELHTLGVEGGYTQNDVREVARCFTGWSIERPQELASFVFRPAAHDPGEKIVLGTRIPAGGGREDGEKVLDLLARHPSTARFVARKLCRRFVADEPPAALVERVAAAYLRSDGDLRTVYAAVFTSPELWSEAALGAKTKSPLELAASAVRALGGRVEDPRALAAAVGRMGEPLYQCQPPTGYDETAKPWLAGGALLARLEFGRTLGSGRLPGVLADPGRLAAGSDDPDLAARRLATALLGREPSEPVRRALSESLAQRGGATPGETLATISGLILGSPDFQKR